MNFYRNALRIALLMTAMALFTQVYSQPSGQWIWQGGDSVDDMPAVYGTQGTPSAANNPGARNSYASCKDASGNFWLFGGADANGNYYNDLWEYTPSTRQWTWVSNYTIPNVQTYNQIGLAFPGARTGAIMGWNAAVNYFWIYGGQGYDAKGNYGYLNDLWLYEPDEGIWEYVSGSTIANQSGIYTGNGKTPGGRSFMSGGLDPSGELWFFGGYGYGSNGVLGLMNDVWEYNYFKKQWVWRGGDSTSDSYSVYNKKGVAGAGEPVGRYLSLGWVDGSSNLWIFGGNGYGSNYADYGDLNDLWKFTPSNSTTGGTWTWVSGADSTKAAGVYGTEGVPATANTPGARALPFGTPDASGNLLLFGGNGYDANGGLGDLDDCWKYNPTANQWTWINGSNGIEHPPVYPPAPGNIKAGSDPGARWEGGVWTDGSDLWIMGGARGNNDIKGDLWELNFSPYLTTAGNVGKWTWVGGPDTANSPEVIAGVGQPVSIEMPGARNGSSYGMDGQGNFWIFGGNGYDTKDNFGLLNDLWQYSPQSNVWNLARGGTLVNQYGTYGQKGSAMPANTPGSRSGQTGCFDKNFNFWVFGGRGYAASGSSGGLNDLWELPHARPPWAWTSGVNATNGSASYGTVGVAASGNTPGYRTASCSAIDGAGNIWIFGGLGEDGNGDTAVELNDLWKYNPVTKQWTWVAGSKVGNGAPVYNSSGGNPGAREGAGSWFDAAGNLWIFGGFNSTYGYYNDLWEFTPTPAPGYWKWVGGDQNTTTVIHPGVYGTMGAAASTNWPGPRRSSAITHDAAGNVWLFGGSGRDVNSALGVLGDLWKYSPASGQWTWMGGDNTISTAAIYGIMGSGNPGDNPGSRQLSAAWVDGSGNFWLAGGSDYAGKYYNDVWKFTPPPAVSLPIEEVTLEGQAEANANSLTWRTIDELNTAGFEVERSTDGTNFFDIGSVTAVGNGNNSYSFMDSQLPRATQFFYRLKMSDKDGTITYSQTILLYTVAPSGLSVYPNPTHGSVTLQLKDNSLLNTQLKLLSIDGRLITEQVITAQQQLIDLSRVSRGVYVLQFANGSSVKVLKE